MRASEGRRAALPASHLPRVRVRYAPAALLDPGGVEHPLSLLQDLEVVALAGLAHPAGFLRTLGRLGARVSSAELYPDHYPYPPREAARLAARGRALGARIVTTEKDAVRLPAGFAAWTVRLGVEVLEGEEHLRRALRLPAAP